MMTRPKRSIRKKLTGIIMLTSTIAVLLACFGFLMSDLRLLHEDRVGSLSTLAQVAATNSTAALIFEDAHTAREVLNALRADRSIVAAGIYTTRGQPFARYEPNPSIHIPRVLQRDGFHQHGGDLELYYGIWLDKERVGTLYIASDSSARNAVLQQYAVIACGIVLVSLLLAFFLSSKLQRTISDPIVDLASVAKRVSLHKDYSIRAAITGDHDNDEIGNLLTGFNGMLAEIGERDRQLLEHQTSLEATVAIRTAELMSANEKLFVAKNVAEQVAEVNAQLARESALILNSVSDGIMGVDINNRPTFLNPAAARMLGTPPGVMSDKSVHDSFHHSHADGTPMPESECPNRHAMLRGESFLVSNDTFWRTDGTSFPTEYSSTQMRDEGGHIIGSVIMFRDVTERRAVERLKSEFVSTVSHELRTPLTSIRGALGLLSSGMLGAIGEKAQRMLSIAVNNTDRLVRLINDILDLERIESGKVELVRGSVDAGNVMVQALESVQSMADAAGVRLVIEPASAALWGDSDRIIQTLTNLLGNAIKFSSADTTVTLSGAVTRSDFAFCVADHGRGIPEEKLLTIFERFSQVDASDSRDKGGSGLGLAICHSIVGAHGGRIWAEKNSPDGSRFVFTIPLAVAASVPDASPQPPKTILVCQDAGSMSISLLLSRHGFHVVSVTSPADAVARAATIQPDAIILDVANGGPGWQLVETLKDSLETRDIPIVVATGQPPESYESYAAAVAKWVRQPLNGGALIGALDLVFHAPSILVVEDDLDLARVMTTALESHGVRALHASTGADALQLCNQHQPNLIVLDLVLPDMDGFAVVTALREVDSLRRIPLLVYSALDVGSADQSRLRLGPTEFLTKSRSSLADFEAHVVRLLETVTTTSKGMPNAA